MCVKKVCVCVCVSLSGVQIKSKQMESCYLAFGGAESIRERAVKRAILKGM